MYRRILQDPLRFPPEDVVSPEARDVLAGLLTRDPAYRLGSRGALDIKRHPFFSRHLDWGLLAAKKIQPPFKPSVVSFLFFVSHKTVCEGKSSLMARWISFHFIPNHPMLYQASAIDTSNFDQTFTSEIPLDSVVDDSNLSETVQQQFAGFSYDGGQHQQYPNGGMAMTAGTGQSMLAPRSIVG